MLVICMVSTHFCTVPAICHSPTFHISIVLNMLVYMMNIGINIILIRASIFAQMCLSGLLHSCHETISNHRYEFSTNRMELMDLETLSKAFNLSNLKCTFK